MHQPERGERISQGSINVTAAPGYAKRYAREGEMMIERPPRQAALAPEIGRYKSRRHW
jgi:hypothetical protein